jgi:hypothetical protein
MSAYESAAASFLKTANGLREALTRYEPSSNLFRNDGVACSSHAGGTTGARFLCGRASGRAFSRQILIVAATHEMHGGIVTARRTTFVASPLRDSYCLQYNRSG